MNKNLIKDVTDLIKIAFLFSGKVKTTKGRERLTYISLGSENIVNEINCLEFINPY